MEDRPKPFLARLRIRYPTAYDSVSMLFYLVLVYAWGIAVHPVGRDYAFLASRKQGAHSLAESLCHNLFVGPFGDWAMGYHLVSAALLFGCMICIYFLVAASVRGPFWLGTLAATLFMANPATGGAILQVSGVVHVLYTFVALAAMALYAVHTVRPAVWKYGLALLLCLVASMLHPANALLFLAFIAYELLVVPKESRVMGRMLPFGLIAPLALLWNVSMVREAGMDLAGRFSPLYFLFYPIGFLPETVRTFNDMPWTGALAAATVLFLLFLIARAADSGPLAFGVIALALPRLAYAGHPIDPVDLTGGEQLLLSGAFYQLAFVALMHRIMLNPKWRFTIIWATTLMCVVYFGMQIHKDFRWRAAAAYVKEFQKLAVQMRAENPNRALAVCPDYQSYRGAPVGLSDSIRFVTPYTGAIPHVSAFPMRKPHDDVNVAVDQWSEREGLVAVSGTTPLEAMIPPQALDRPGDSYEYEACLVGLKEITEEGFILIVRPLGQELPDAVVPALPARDDETPDAE